MPRHFVPTKGPICPHGAISPLSPKRLQAEGPSSTPVGGAVSLQPQCFPRPGFSRKQQAKTNLHVDYKILSRLLEVQRAESGAASASGRRCVHWSSGSASPPGLRQHLWSSGSLPAPRTGEQEATPLAEGRFHPCRAHTWPGQALGTEVPGGRPGGRLPPLGPPSEAAVPQPGRPVLTGGETEQQRGCRSPWAGVSPASSPGPC